MNPVVVKKLDGQRILVDLDRVAYFEEVGNDTVMMIDTGQTYRLQSSFNNIAKAYEATLTTPVKREME